MTERTRIRVKVGLTVTAALIILIYGLSFLKNIQFGIETNELTVYFNDVSGLKEGDQVGVNGVMKGKVSKIELEGDSVKVEFFIAKDVVLKKDYNINVSMIELMSGKQISISPGTSDTIADITKPLKGSKTQDAVSLIKTMNTIGEDIKVITDKLNKTTDHLDEVVNNVNDIIGDENFKGNVKGTAFNFNTAAKNLNILLEENRINLKVLSTKLNSIADNLDNTVSESKPEIKETFQNIRELTLKLDSLSVSLNKIVLGTRDSTTTVGKLLTQDEFYTTLHKTIQNIDKLIKKINKEGFRLKLF